MIGQTLLPNEELHKWWEIETSIGKKPSQAQKSLSSLYLLLESFSDGDKAFLFNLINTDKYWKDKPKTFDLTLLRLTLIKRFIEKNKISIIKEYLNIAQTGRKLEIQIYLLIANELFTNQKLPEDIFTYCKYRKKGSPTTWLQISSQLNPIELIEKLNRKSDRLCNVLLYRLHTKREVRFKLKTPDKYILLISKPIGVVMIPTEDHALEAQGIAYTTLVLNTADYKIGYVSKSRREVSEVHRFIKNEIYPNSVFSPRKDKVMEDKELLEKLVNVNEQDHGLDIIGITFRNIELTNSPSIRIEATNDRPIYEALQQLKGYWRNEGLTSVSSITYRMNGSKIGIYSYESDEWQRRNISVNTRGKSARLEAEFLDKIKNVLGEEIKETKFVVKQLTPVEIVEKFLFDKAISIDPAIPKKADEILSLLLKYKLILKQKSVTKRRCEDWNCHTFSWIDLVCGTCGRDMIVVGEGLSIAINEGLFLKELTVKIEGSLHDYEVIRQKIQRNKNKKWIIRLTNKRTNLSTYIVPILYKRDLSFCESLIRESYGLITLNDSHFSGKKDELEAQGINCLKLTDVVTNLLLNLENKQNDLLAMFSLSIKSQESNNLQRIYQRLRASADAISNKSNSYDEDLFEIDIKNILQALVPNVVRLGAKFKGMSVPDGYCAYRIGREKGYRLFGWDAKYSFSNRYTLTNSDYKKQRKYIKWLNDNQEPKALGKLRIYSFISNFNDPKGFNTVITKLQNIPEKKSNTKVILIEDMLIVKIAEWIMTNTAKVQEHGPEVAKIFFRWLGSANKRKGLTWLFRTSEDWIKLESLLNGIN